MKTTSFEISKKLAEIGFKSEYDYAYFDTRKSWKRYNCPPRKSEYADSEFVPFYTIEEGHPDLELVNVKEHGPEYNPSYGYNDSKPIPSYDLETILDALPESINDFYCKDSDSYSSLELTINKNNILYTNGYDFINVVHNGEDKSLADTAARLLILLESKGLITFGDKK